MRIDVLSIVDCPNSQAVIDQVHDVLVSLGHPDVPVIELRITTPEEAAAIAFAGSPTILIDGVDIVPGTVLTSSLACRIYRTDTGIAGHPTTAQIVEAIRSHRPGRGD